MSVARLAGVGFALVGLATPAQALCPLCNATVRLDADLAACFVKRADAELRRLADNGGAFVIVDLSDCPRAELRQALPTATPAATPQPLDSSFVADAVALRCLAGAILAHTGPMDPGVVFDLAEICA